jgi:hypothetical protein
MVPCSPTTSSRSLRAEEMLLETIPKPASNSSTPASSLSAPSSSKRAKAEARLGSAPKASLSALTQ